MRTVMAEAGTVTTRTQRSSIVRPQADIKHELARTIIKKQGDIDADRGSDDDPFYFAASIHSIP